MTQPSFNLVDEPWIPCCDSTGQRVLLGLEETLARAHELSEVYDDSPLVTVTLHRLLLALVHHLVQGPKDMAAWAELWKNGNGRFNGESVRDYLRDGQRYPRFDLFHEEWPFYQCSQVPFSTMDAKTENEKSYEISVAKLATELAAGNNDTLFDHSVDDCPQAISAGRAARLLLACHGFSMGGRITFERKEDGSADASPLVKGAVAVIRGESLFQTLLLNLHAWNGANEEPFGFKAREDLPAWERTEHTQPQDRKVDGYLDLLTRQSRRIRLKPVVSDTGVVSVRSAVVMKGEQFIDGFHRHGHETMVAFNHNKDATVKQDPFPAIGFSEDRALWRSSLSLFQSLDQLRTRPKMVDWLDELANEDYLPRDSPPFPMDLFGLSSDQAKVLLWRHERLPLSLQLINSPALLLTLQEALARTENVRKVLWQTATEFGRVLLLQDESKQPGTEQRKDIQRIVDSLGVERRFWSAMEVPFHRFLGDLQITPAADGHEQSDAALEDWNEILRTAARRVFANAIKREDRSARSLKAAVNAERLFFGLLRKTLPQPEAQPAGEPV
ncbi:MAG: type I-E CRISPR-associated protein Cse1/CasA [Planctomycetota bacterium]|nr:type I-E CRISPR-associated protein Cse1/CasA [Planctomycetota bacterium]